MDMRISFVFLFVSVSSVTSLKPIVTSLKPIVNTTHGRIRGFQETILQKTINVFYGIPFAKPPTGDLRFKRTEELPSWGDSIRDAFEMKSACYQRSRSFFSSSLRINNATRSEDCLYLNIWAPYSPGHKISTLVWIHGGAFLAGSITTPLYNGRYLTAKNDVIVVGISYRIGALGFLYTGSDDAPGNQGLLDQSEALNWVYKNIERFGGDKYKITIFGGSAGSASVNHHLFSPLSRDVFTSAIMESGSSLAYWSVNTKSVAKKASHKLAELLGCKTDTDDDVLRCLRQSNPQDIVENQVKVSAKLVPFAPIVDGYFFPDHPKEMLKKGNVKNASVIIGINKNEATLFLPFEVPNYFSFASSSLSVNRSAFLAVLDVLLQHTGGGTTTKNVLINEYETSMVPSLRPSYLTLSDSVYSDLVLKCNAIEFASKYASMGNSVFLYSYEHRLSSLMFPVWMGVIHSYELELVFGRPLDDDQSFTDEERTISLDIMTFWTNLAKTGNPNGITGNPRWPLYDTNEERYIVLDATMATKQGLRHRKCAFWEHTIPLILDAERKAAEDKQCDTNESKTIQPVNMVFFTVMLLRMVLTLY